MESHVFHDFDEFTASIRDVESKMLLRNPRRRVWTIDAVNVDGLNVQIGRLGSGNIACGQRRSDGYMLYLPLTPGIQYTANGEALDLLSCAILEPGCEFCISTKVEHDWCAVSLPTWMFNRSYGGSESILDSVQHKCRVTALDHKSAFQFRWIVQQIMTAATAHAEFESTPAAKNAARHLFNVASSSLGTQTAREFPREGRPRIPREQIIRSATDIIEQQGNPRVTIADLAAAAEVSERTLRTAFHEFFGIGPTRFLMLQQLHQIRRALKNADGQEATVGGILMEHGEYALSRFASRYKKQFGESPSETLRSSK